MNFAVPPQAAAPSTDMRSHGVSISVGLSMIVVFLGKLVPWKGSLVLRHAI